ncbi:cupin-like domain-containing protein [Fulvivirga maritima]|uniref:cupin-like domain-containing protein n=1 Tax=Fulvivirga maritima TaxID=2904247 RepID=UPI001F430142|nr:cupin-like domain-containing protein [Fulvivirga maritima]UII24651.1 cupin-like domain-containing protein [Fulvivirga maritima]
MQNLTKQLFDLMSDGICPSKFSGICEVALYDNEQNHRAFIELKNDTLTYNSEITTTPDVVVQMHVQTLGGVLARLDKFDLRDPGFLMQVNVQGDTELAGYLFNLIKRPSKEVAQLIKETEDKCEDYKQEINTIEKFHKPTKDQVLQLIDDSIPFVMTGVLDDWEFLTASMEEIKSKYGNTRLRPVVENGKEGFETMGDFISKVESTDGNMVYTGGCDLPPAMWSKFRMPFFAPETFTTPQIWMGSKSGDSPCTALHRDCCNGMLANIQGRKKNDPVLT